MSLRDERKSNDNSIENVLVKYDKYFPEDVGTRKFTQKEFVEMMLNAMKDIHPDWQLNLTDKETVKYTSPDGDNGFMSFSNIWDGMKHEVPDIKIGSLRNWLHNYDEPGESQFESGIFVAVVRNFGDQLNVASDERATMAGVELAPGLQAVFAMDSPSGVMYVPIGNERLQDRSYDELLAKAKDNLRNALAPKVEVYKTRPENSWLLRIDNNSESSLILFEDIMSFMEKETGGKLIFCVPTRDVFVCSADVGDAERKYMIDVAKNGWERGPYSISPHVYSWKKGVIEIAYG